MADITCLICGKPRYRNYDLCSDCLQMTAQHDCEENKCIFVNCSAKAIDKLDVCGNHLVETVYGLIVPYHPIVCNVEGCTENSVRDYPVCDIHWILAYKSCLSANSGNQKASSRVAKFYHATDSKIAKEYRPKKATVQITDGDEDDFVECSTEHPHYTTPVIQEEIDVDSKPKISPHVVRSSPLPIPRSGERQCMCGKPADPRGNKCPECFAKYNALKFGVGRGKCQCGAPLGEKGTMCQACFVAFKKAKFGTPARSAINPLLTGQQQIMQPIAPQVLVHPMMQHVVPPMMRQFQHPMVQYGFSQPIRQDIRQDMFGAPKQQADKSQ